MTTFTLSKTGLTAAANDYGISGTVTVTLNAKQIKQSWKNRIIQWPSPSSKNVANEKPPRMNAVNMKMITHEIQIDGWLDDTQGGDSAVTKKKQLLAMASQTTPSSNIIFVWRGETFANFQITEATFTDTWETVAGGDSDQIDSDIPQTSPFGKIEFMIKGVIAWDATISS